MHVQGSDACREGAIDFSDATVQLATANSALDSLLSILAWLIERLKIRP